MYYSCSPVISFFFKCIYRLTDSICVYFFLFFPQLKEYLSVDFMLCNHKLLVQLAKEFYILFASVYIATYCGKS